MALDAAAQARDNLVKQQRLDEEGRDGRRWRVLAGKFAACFERARRRAGKHAAGSHRQGAVEFGGGGRCVSDGHDPRLAWKTGEMLTLRRRRCHVRAAMSRALCAASSSSRRATAQEKLTREQGQETLIWRQSHVLGKG